MPNNTGPMTKDNMVELKPCRECGAPCRAIDGTNEHFKGMLWACSNHGKLGGNCETPFYLTAEAWNTRATMHGSDSGALREALAKIRALALSGDFSPDDIGGNIGTISLRNPDGLEILGIIDAALNTEAR